MMVKNNKIGPKTKFRNKLLTFGKDDGQKQQNRHKNPNLDLLTSRQVKRSPIPILLDICTLDDLRVRMRSSDLKSEL